MRRLTFILLYLSCCSYIGAQLKSHVSECFELTSIVFRLAGAEEYNNKIIPDYKNDIDKYFAKYRNHKLISYAKEIREKDKIGYDAIPTATGCIMISNGKVIVNPDYDASTISRVDERWSEESFLKFVDLLDDFYQKTRFNRFYNKHKGLYKIAEERMDELLSRVDKGWFENYFDKKPDNVLIYTSMCNGPSNYAITIRGKEEIKGILIGCSDDESGLPWYHKNMLTVIMHELLHHYTNPLLADCWEQIDSAAQNIHSYVKDDMLKLAYGHARSTIMEWFVNLFVIMYFQDNSGLIDIPVANLIADYQSQGFIWMERAVAFMKNFQSNRSLYPMVEGFIPQIVGFINNTSDNFDQVINEFNNRKPYIVETFPAKGSVTSTKTDTVKIKFSEPMLYSSAIYPVEKEGINALPIIDMEISDDGNSFLFIIDKTQLEKGKTYGAMMHRYGFQSLKAYPMNEDYEYSFKVE